MGRYRFELATRSDDAELRQILAQSPMDGKISLTLKREPSYFDAAVVDGSSRQIVVCRDAATDSIVGFGSRSLRQMYVNGELKSLGYLGTLRSLKRARNRGLLANGYRYLRELHRDGRAVFYLTTIAEGNDPALRILLSGRAGLPAYHFVGRFHTVAIPVIRRMRLRRRRSASCNVREATESDLPILLDFLNRVGPRYQFFPKYDASDFFGVDSTFKELKPSDLLLAFKNGQLVATLGSWDQHAFRQTVVEGYEGPLRWLRPAYNCWAALCSHPKLPSPGDAFRYVMGVLPVIEDNDEEVYSALLDCTLDRLLRTEHDYLLIGLHESHRLLASTIRRASTSYATRLYCVTWDHDVSLVSQFDGRTPYLELGCL